MAQKKYEDYIEKIYDEFPDIDKESINDIVKYGLKKIHTHASTTQDIFLKMDRSSDPFYLYIGHQDKDKYKQNIRSKTKQHNKIRKLFKERHGTFDGFSYFGLTDEEFDLFNENKVIEKITTYKLIDETSIRRGVNHIFRTKLDIEDYDFWTKIVSNYKLNDCEYISKRNNSKFENIKTQELI